MENCQRSFIINGLDESKRDVDSVLEIVHAADNISLLPCDIKSFTCIERQSNVNNKPRTICVTLITGRRQLRSDIINAAPKLCKSTDPQMKGIFINPDRTKGEQKRDFNLQSKLRRIKAAGEQDLCIHKGKMVIKGN